MDDVRYDTIDVRYDTVDVKYDVAFVLLLLEPSLCLGFSTWRFDMGFHAYSGLIGLRVAQ